MPLPKIGSMIRFHRNHPAGEFDAITTGYELQQDHDLKDGLPPINLVYLNPDHTLALGGAGFREAFDIVYSVPHKAVSDGGPNHYTLPLQDMIAGIGVLRQQLKEKDAELANLKELPSAPDLDALAAEGKVKDITSGKKSKKD